MSLRFLTAASLIALVSACSAQPGPFSLSPTQQAAEAYRSGNFAAAEQAYAGVLSVSPNDATAMLGLGEVYEATGRASEAAQLYRQVSASRSGAIRTWDDGSFQQDGVTEVAMRRLGALGLAATVQNEAPTLPAPTLAAPIVVAPTVVAPTVVRPTVVTQIVTEPTTYAAPAPTGYWPEEPVYALDQDGVVYFADPEGTQPIQGPVFETREAGIAAAPAIPHNAVQYAAPAIAAPITYEPAPIEYTAVPTTYAPAPIAYETAPIAYEPTPVAYEPAPIAYEAAPIAADYTSTQFKYEAAPMPEPTSVAYTPVPISRTYEAAPIAEPVAPAYTPAPVALRTPTAAALLQRDQPGYAVVDGNFVYVSAEDIARGATAPAPVANVGSAQGYGVPTPVSSSSIPVGTPQTYSAPHGVDVMNGIPKIDLN